MASAVDRVFDTPELLEAILDDLDMQTLLLSQRVNRTFNATISGSLCLQRALWFRPMSPSQIESLGDKRNPLLVKIANKAPVGYSLWWLDGTRLHKYKTIYVRDGPDVTPQQSGPGTWKHMLPFQQEQQRENYVVKIISCVGQCKDFRTGGKRREVDLEKKPGGLKMADVVEIRDEWLEETSRPLS